MTVAGQLPALEEAVVAAAKVSIRDNFKELDSDLNDEIYNHWYNVFDEYILYVNVKWQWSLLQRYLLKMISKSLIYDHW